MKTLKYIIVIFLSMVYCLGLISEERKKSIHMKDLTDPKSPSYVPYPYPKNRSEIIADFKYYIGKSCKKNNGYKESFVHGFEPITDKISLNLLGPNPQYQFGKIFKVKNRIEGFTDDYFWLIMIMNRNGQISMRVTLTASGLMMGAGAIEEKDIAAAAPTERQKFLRLMKVISEEDVQNILSKSIGRAISGKEIKKIEQVAFPSSKGDFLNPMWEIKMFDGTIYYYSEIEDMIYKIDKKISWKKNKNGNRPDKLSLVPHSDYLPDMIDDELIILTKIPETKSSK